MSAIVNLGLRVPENIPLVRYNDIPIVSRLSTPSAVRIAFDPIATSALYLLLARGSKRLSGLQIVAPTQIPRLLTAPRHR